MGYAIPNIGEAIKTARLAAGLTQRDLAKVAAVSQAQISLAETGSDIRLSTLQMITGALDLVPMLVPRKAQSIVRGVIATQTTK